MQTKISNIRTILVGDISESDLNDIGDLIKSVYDQLSLVHSGGNFDFNKMFIKIYNYDDSKKLIYKTSDSCTVITSTHSGHDRHSSDLEIVVKSNHFDETECLYVIQNSEDEILMNFDKNYEFYNEVVSMATCIGLITFLKRCLGYFKKTSLTIHGV